MRRRTICAASEQMPNSWEWMLSRRYLGATRKGGGVALITTIAFAGIALSVATLIIVMAVMNGFRDELLGRILGLGGHVYVYGERMEDAWPDALSRIRAIPGVTEANAVVEGQALAVGVGDRAAGGFVKGMTLEGVGTVLAPFGGPASGSLDGYETGGGIVLGYRLAARLGLEPDDPVTLIAPKGVATPFGTAPRRKSYRVVALFNSGMFEYDDNFVFMPLEQAQAFFGLGAGITAIEARVDDPDRVYDWRPALIEAAQVFAPIVDWRQRNDSYINALKTERDVMRLILFFIVAVATLNIITGLVMLVKDKRRDIGILRTMGASQGAVMRIFFTAGCLIGGAGVGAGVILGWAFTANIGVIHDALSALAGRRLFDPEVYFLSQIPARMEVSETIFVAVWALLMAALVTLYPSWRAARLDPVEALRYE